MRIKNPFTTHTYESEEFLDGISVARKLNQPLEKTFKTLVAGGKSGSYYVFLIPVAMELDLKKASKSVGEKSIDLIHIKDINRITGYIRGGCSPIGMKKQFQTIIHESAMNFETIYFSGGRLGSQIEMNPLELVDLVSGKIDAIVVGMAAQRRK